MLGWNVAERVERGLEVSDRGLLVGGSEGGCAGVELLANEGGFTGDDLSSARGGSDGEAASVGAIPLPCRQSAALEPVDQLGGTPARDPEAFA